jgi:hypothetical protein
MKAQDVSRGLQLREWASQVDEQMHSGLSITDWCELHGIKRKTFYYRRQKLREEYLDTLESGSGLSWLPESVKQEAQHAPAISLKPTFVALPLPNTESAAIKVRISDYVVEIHNDAEENMIGRVLRMVARL